MKNKIIKGFTVLALSAVVLTGCNFGKKEPDKTVPAYNITFQKTEEDSVILKNTNELVFPSVTKKDFVFGGWFLENDVFETEVTLEYLKNNAPSGDIVVYAKWLPTLKSISVKTSTLQNQYYINQELDLTNAKLVLTYSDLSEKEVILTLDMISGFNSRVVGIKQMIISYEELTSVFEYEVLGLSVVNLEIIQNTMKNTYNMGDELDTINSKIKVYYNNNTTEIIGIKNDYVSGFSTIALGKYIIKISYLNMSIDFSYEVKLKDNILPEFNAVNNYDYDEETGEVTKVYNASNEVVYDALDHSEKTEKERKELAQEALSDLRHAVPSVVVLESVGEGAVKQKIVSIPAAFATDNVSNVSNMTFTRIVRSSTSSIQEPITETTFNKAANYTFKQAGNYTIRYIVRDEAGNEKTTMFDVKVVNSIDELKDAKTTVSLVGVAPFAYEGGKVTFTAPTANDNYDSRLQVNTFYRFDNENADVRHALKADKNGKMTIDLTTVPASAESLVVYAEAINDYGVTKTVQSTVRIYRIGDQDAPSFIFTNEEFFTKSYELGQFITVPTAGLMDNGQIITDLASEKKETTPGSGEYVPGIKWGIKEGANYTTKGVLGFYPVSEGTYTIVYTGWDSTGAETISREFTLTVADTIKPSITLETEYTLPSAVEFNKDVTNTIKLPAVTLFDGVRNAENSDDNFEQTEAGDIQLVVKVTDSNGNEITVSQLEEESFGGIVTRYTFEATKQNIYTIKYIATDASGNVSELVRTVEVGDVVAPTLTWDDKYEIPTTVNLNSSFELDMSKATIVDGDSDEVIKPVITMTAPDGKTVSSILTNEYKWKFDQVGSYTLRITLKDEAGNENPYTYTITVSNTISAKNFYLSMLI